MRLNIAYAALALGLTASAGAMAQGFNAPPPGGGQYPPNGGMPPQSPHGGGQMPPMDGQPPPGMGQLPMGQPPGFAPPPGFGGPQQPGRQQPGGQPSRPNLADELTDFGVPAQDSLQTNVGSDTPTSIPGGHVITTTEMRQAVGSNILFIDVWATGPHPSLPGAILMPGAGNPGSFNDDIQQKLWTALSQLSNRQPQQPMVFFCTGPRCWESYNAALRAINMGFKTVLWYRGGLAAWQAAGLQMSGPGQGGGPGGGAPGQGGQSGPGFGR